MALFALKLLAFLVVCYAILKAAARTVPFDIHTPVVLIVAAFLFLNWHFRPFTLDDAFISFRYARNLSEGHGLVFNPGEKVEGYSNFLWVALLGGAHRIGFDIILAARLLGILAGVLAIVLTYRLASHLIESSAYRYLPPAFTAVNVSVVYYTTGGLETPLYLFLILLGIFRYLQEFENRTKFPGSSACFLLAALTRPEGIMFLALSAGHRIYTALKRGDGRGMAALDLLLFHLLYILFLVWRYSYYGLFVPNVYYAKPGIALNWDEIKSAFFYIHTFVMENGTYLLFAFLFVPLFHPRNRHFVAYLFLFIVACLLFNLYAGGDWMAKHRFLVPVVPLLYLLVFSGLEQTVTRIKGLAPAAALLLAVLAGSMVHHCYTFYDRLQRNTHYDHAHISAHNAEIGRWLARNAAATDTVVTDEIGAIGYYSGLKIVDMLGLVDPDIARILHAHRFNPYGFVQDMQLRSAVQRKVARHILAKRPSFVLIDYQGAILNGAYNARDINPITMRELYAAMGEDYEFIRPFQLSRYPPKTFLLFKRKYI